MAARFGAGHLMGDVKSSARSDAAVLATPATCLLRRPRVFPVPAHRLVLRVESVSKYPLVIRPGLPWHQGTPRAAVIARMKFSLAERVPKPVKEGTPAPGRPRPPPRKAHKPIILLYVSSLI